MTPYVNRHESQYQPGASSRTRKSGCSWTSAANGADAATGGRIDPEPDAVLAKVKISEETSPRTPGWSLADVELAMKRLGVPFDERSGRGWDAVVAAHKAGLYIVLQGDSDQFGNGTCSGDFDGDHAIGVHPAEDRLGRWRIDDPICPGARYESPVVLRRYAEKFLKAVRFGVFTTPVPVIPPDTSTEEPMERFGIPQHPGIATSKVPTKLYPSSDLKGTAVDVPAGHTKRYIGWPSGKRDSIAIIGNDGDPKVDGKSALFGKAADWHIRETP